MFPFFTSFFAFDLSSQICTPSSTVAVPADTVVAVVAVAVAVAVVGGGVGGNVDQVNLHLQSLLRHLLS